MDRNFEDLSSYYEYYDGLKEYDFSKQLGIAINGNDFKITDFRREKYNNQNEKFTVCC